MSSSGRDRIWPCVSGRVIINRSRRPAPGTAWEEKRTDVSFEQQTPKVYSVTELTREIQDVLEGRFPFIWVEGEISNFSAPLSGHYYMALKDGTARIRAVMFRLQARYLKFVPEDGMKVIAQGRIGVYAPRGEYQVILDYLEPMGVGALALAFEQLKKKLAARGLFDEEIKRPLPFLPRRIAVITSPTGAAIRDFLKIVRRRFANMEIIIIPVRVQGEGAAREMVEALALANRELAVDVIVLTRGGGSLEDLWAFNQEELALAIRASGIPVVSAVGHEIDLTISDLAADLRAPTPSAAAEMLAVEKEGIVNRLADLENRLVSSMTASLKSRARDLARAARGLRDPGKRLEECWLRLDDAWGRLLKGFHRQARDRRRRLHTEARVLLRYSPVNLLASAAQRLDFLAAALRDAMKRAMSGHRTRVSVLAGRIEDLSPLSVLRRGYSITRRLPGREILKEAAGVAAGDRVQILLREGELRCRVEKTAPDREI